MKEIAVLVLFLLHHSLLLKATNYLCKDGSYELGLSHCYKLFENKEPYKSARDICKSDGSELVKINSEAENSFINDSFAKFAPFWIGLNDLDVEGNFSWINGEVLGPNAYTAWVDEDASSTNADNSDCVQFNSEGLWEVQQGLCDSSQLPYLCKQSACNSSDGIICDEDIVPADTSLSGGIMAPTDTSAQLGGSEGFGAVIVVVPVVILVVVIIVIIIVLSLTLFIWKSKMDSIQESMNGIRQDINGLRTQLQGPHRPMVPPIRRSNQVTPQPIESNDESPTTVQSTNQTNRSLTPQGHGGPSSCFQWFRNQKVVPINESNDESPTTVQIIDQPIQLPAPGRGLSSILVAKPQLFAVSGKNKASTRENEENKEKTRRSPNDY